MDRLLEATYHAEQPSRARRVDLLLVLQLYSLK
jgi:hypothetical protein